ncbi:MAG: SUMF1/EgtB/PvdO family nonheme iron enzyme [Spirochaetaceae bacterium]|jgi:formylglycine-generating enzyme required for sulfatase activity/TolB-like protein|nr:SUMF1/EgtB/PvdO family nonheme iron enzyme [Spirochaetaceae bacterium]
MKHKMRAAGRIPCVLAVLLFAPVIALSQEKPRLAILPFTGGSGDDGETIGMLLSFEPEIANTFTVVPRTSAIDSIMKEQEFQRSGLTDTDTISGFGKQLNADFVVAGHIQQFGNHNLVLINIINVETFQQITGDYREYAGIEDIKSLLPEMAKRMVSAIRLDTAALPGLAVLPFAIPSGVNAQDAELLAQLLATEIANSGKYAVLPRTQTIRTAMAEQEIQRSGITDPDSIKAIGQATNARYVLSGNVRSLGSRNMFMVSILNIEKASQERGNQIEYRDITDGLQLMAELSYLLTGVRSGETAAFQENFVKIEGGTFTMGSPLSEPDRDANETPHQVTVSGFYLGKYEVTQKEYEEVTGINPGAFKNSALPVEQVSWYDAVEYCNKRSEREGLVPAYTIHKTRFDPNNTNSNDAVAWLVTWNRSANGYRLPTEAEWEYACRAGTATPFNTGGTITGAANYNGVYPATASGPAYPAKTVPVGTYPANKWGLSDMHGNVWEWCWDWFGDYGEESQADLGGPAAGIYRVIRGGGWYGYAPHLRSAARLSLSPSSRASYLGFRVARGSL